VQKKSAELAPSHEFGLAHTYALAGYTEEALKIAKKLEERNDIWDTWCLAVIYSAINDADKVFYWLDKAEELGHPFILWTKTQPYFLGYKDDPRYKSFVKRLDVP
jgi:hypothetical protein